MCRLSVPRRSVLAAPLLLPLAARAEALVEPVLRLPDADGLAVALTLDACPGGFDAGLAAALADAGIKATVMLTGAWLRGNKQGLAFLLSRPDIFAFQNHGARHVPPVLGERQVFGLPAAGTPDAIAREATEGAAAIKAATGAAPAWYRGATGLYSPAALVLIRSLGLSVAGYSLNADQGASLPAATVAERMSAARPGEVIIAHLNQPARPSGAGVAAGALALKRRGASFAWLPAQGTAA